MNFALGFMRISLSYKHITFMFHRSILIMRDFDYQTDNLDMMQPREKEKSRNEKQQKGISNYPFSFFCVSLDTLSLR